MDMLCADSVISAMARRAVDALLAAAVLLILLPVLLVVLCLWRYWQKPALVAVHYIGMQGRLQTGWRFRFAAEQHGVAMRWMGDMLDAMPAMFDILCARLAWVGPRRIEARELAEFASLPARFTVRPGLVSLWWLRQQTNMHFSDELQSDREYLRQRTFAGDLGLLGRALLARWYGKPVAAHAATLQIGGIRLINLSMDELVAAILAALRNSVRTRIAFVNPDCVNRAAGNPDYQRCLAQADWVCPDGIGMKIAGRLLGRDIRQNLNGTDLFPALCAALAGEAKSVYLLGAAPGVAQRVAGWIAQHHPTLRVAGAHTGFIAAADESSVIAQIRAARADVLLVAMGAPLQELWLEKHLAQTGAVIGIGVGGLFDFYSGRIPRAPLWLREVGGEWIYRLIQEPKRMWRRYLIGNAEFLFRIVLEMAQQKANRRAQ